MTTTRHPRLRHCAIALFAAGWLIAAHAERGDRARPIEVTSSDAQADHLHQTAEFSGDVVVSQGSMEIHADRVTMREGSKGERLGVASGTPGVPVRFRQRGDRPGEWSEGQAQRVEYDSVANEVRLIGGASLRNLNGTELTQSIAGPVITYDTARDTVTSTETAHAAESDGVPGRHRVTVVFAPRLTPADGAAAPTASP